MFDIKPYIFNSLSKIGVEVTPAYPESFKHLPVISFTEIENSDKGVCSKEVLNKITIQIDVWAEWNTLELSREVDEKMVELGFRRVTAQDMDTTSIKRKSMRYAAIINKRNNMIFND